MIEGDPVTEAPKVGLALLHGFGGAPASWDAFRSQLPGELRVCAPELLGHGVPTGTDDRFVFEIERLSNTLDTLAAGEAVEGWWLVGYSMGGRLALGVLADQALGGRCGHPIVGATLIGANPGLENRERRAERCAADERWAQILEGQGTKAFLEEWRDLPLFASQSRLPASVLDAQRRITMALDAVELAGAMRALSLGRMPPYFDVLERIHQPVDWVVGALDLKFSSLAERAVSRMNRARLVSVPHVGHNVVLEAPGQLAQIVTSRIRELGSE